ncbi:hypothetical protein GCM10011344_31350 [Dokdonia pacifica]|uniref:Uncharacterized protein n=1 Tax=Dokdonia pacifica TaxID=1627892 RepID=A0A239BRJ9_9FLAO|nr:hypothetical protein [Dokdonia pacifica]GGG28284.1 hypothetical protein GCM10011344_31350 [Dokdonia pacifica]SNS09664.1 hypothetical protein SAMN06265376_106335 [Dokdonia pacifica]
MGLDITHYKATFEKAEINSLFYIDQGIYADTGGIVRENFSGFNVRFDYFKNYIQEIDCPVELDSVIIVNDKKDSKRIEKHFKSSGRKIFVKENENQLHHDLTEFEKSSGYSNTAKCLDDFEYMGWTILKYYKTIKKEGFYYKKSGYQRKGMNNKFYKRFCSSNIYNFALKEDFDYSLLCVDYYWESDTRIMVEERKKEFNKSFINNFEKGASFMMVSY